jgi:DNA-damage-inducible protein D
MVRLMEDLVCDDGNADVLATRVKSGLEALARRLPNGEEYWLASDLQEPLGYSSWRDFKNAIERAQAAFEKSGGSVQHHIADVRKMVPTGSGARREVRDYALSRRGAYILAMNGDPRKPEIAFIQQYFAEKARMAELHQEVAADVTRIAYRNLLAAAFTTLNSAAKTAGVTNFGVFNGVGLKGLYGISRQDILDRKGLSANSNHYDHAGTDELSLNAYRATLAKVRLLGLMVRTQEQANDVHYQAGQEVRRSYLEFGGMPPEDLPAEENIKKVERRIDRRILHELAPSLEKPNQD